MTTIRKSADGSARRAFEPRTWVRPPGLALLGLALVGLFQAGCRSDGCSTCGFGSKISSGVQSLGNSVQALGARVFKHFDGCAGGDACGCGSEGTIVDSGTPIAPGGIVVPAPGTIVPGPAIESAPTQLYPLDPNPTTGTGSNKDGSNPASTRNAPNGNNKSAYTTMTPRNGLTQGRRSEVTRALLSNTDSPARSNASQGSTDLLDNIPPVDLSSDVTRKAVSANPAPAPSASTPVAPPSAAPVSDTPAPTPAEKVSAAEGVGASLPPINAIAPQAPGIRRFASVAPAVSGGSAPSLEGLDWLKEKGYRTFIDLRRSSEIDLNFVDAVNDRNMVYISLPIVANRLETSRLARFDEMIAQSGNRPLYFCDSDGTRAGLVWYIHLRVVSEEDSQAASGKAEEIGLTEVEVKLAEQYLLTQKPKARSAMAKVASASDPERFESKSQTVVAAEAPASPPPALPSAPVAPSAPVPPSAPAAAPSPSTEPTPAMLPGEPRPQASTKPAPATYANRDLASWRPVAALVLSGLGVPLALWSRTAICEARSIRKRASLPAGAPRSPVALPGSDA
jgi:protein tyrosine phosphatase (PTP) superfamily phosphohydrolase (DUF442 family)